MTERWKPEEGERYYFIGADGKPGQTVFYEVFGSDSQAWALGNCFKTEAEAAAAAEKVKALLLSLPDNGNNLVSNLQDKELPKLTAEVFARPDCPDWAKWAAVDYSGLAYYYSERPFILSDEFGWGVVCGENTQSELIPGKFTHINWSGSRIERPAVLPEWVTVGGYVYDPLYGYGEIVFASEKHFHVEFGGHAAEYSLENVPELKQARLRQYTAAELRKLVGTIIEETACGAGESSLLVTAYNSGNDCDTEPAVMLLDEWIGVNALCSGDYSVDGHVCGVFEHMDAGEWVE